MTDFELTIGKNKITSKDIKAGIKKEDIKDEKLLSIFNAYDDGNEILEEREINRLKQDLQNAASEDGDSTELSRREARHLIKKLGINARAKDLIAFINNLVDSSVNIKSCNTNRKNIITVRDENGSEIKDIYDLDGNFIRSEKQAKYQSCDGILIKEANGTLIFKETKKSSLTFQGINFDSIQNIEYYFKNEEDYYNEKPSKIIRDNGNPDYKTTEEYKYDKNGKKASVVTKRNNEVIAEGTFNEKEELVEEKKYSNGKLNERIAISYKGGKVAQKDIYDDKNTLIKEEKYKNGVLAESVEYTQKNETWKNYEKIVTKYDNNEKIQTSDFIDSRGKTIRHQEFDSKGNIKYDVEYYPNGNKKIEITRNGNDYQAVYYDENGTITNIDSSIPDGYIGDFSQGRTGDCYLLASIIAINNTANGREIISNLITKNSDGSYTIELPGAKKAAEGLNKDPRIKKGKMYITGTYTFSADEVKQIAKRTDLAVGEIDVRLIEAAFEKYRREVMRTKNDNKIDMLDGFGEAGLSTGFNYFKILDSGATEDAMYVLTGKQSETYYNSDAPAVSQSELQQYDSIVTHSYKVTKGSEKHSKADLNKMLDKVMNDINDGHIDYAVTCAFSMGGIDGHALAIKSVTKDSVVLINPWDSSRTLTMSRQDFMKKVYSVSIAEMPYTHSAKPAQKPDFPAGEQEETTPPKPFDLGELISPKQKPAPNGKNKLTPVEPNPPKSDGLTLAPESSKRLTPVDSEMENNAKSTSAKEENAILDKADGNKFNRAKKSKINYDSFIKKDGLTRSISGQEFKNFTKADYRKLINDYLNGTESTKRTIERLVHDKSNWECAKEQDSQILAGLKLIYNNYDKYKNKK